MASNEIFVTIADLVRGAYSKVDPLLEASGDLMKTARETADVPLDLLKAIDRCMDRVDDLRRALGVGVLPDEVIEAAFAKAKAPGPEDKLIAGYGFTWDQLRSFTAKKEWPLTSKLAACLLALGDLAETLNEKATLYDLVSSAGRASK